MGIYGESRIGLVRSLNEDSFYVSEDGTVMVVADGMGGYVGGEIASRTAVKSVAYYFSNYTHASTEQLTKAIAYANDCIISKIIIDPSLEGMGTTLSLLSLVDSTAYWAHVGDSRIYLYRKGMLKQITTDHTVIHELIEDHSITTDEAEKHPQRHVLTRAVGVEKQLEIDTLIVGRGGGSILLCSDGLSAAMSEEEIASYLSHSEKTERQTVKDLFSRIYDEGAPDNATVVLKTV